ncbi:LutB/LldF family L-lactate oxidation iron-sulfur protein [Chondrinema litorale]|uniref:LutB/LldF family L-lactate oxidation iron-sulfur protein n=1 Tax=Chondrinema litorale TaxID=2994555 RepID=UPI0025442F66|nr:LutB/LldF family L-lactate oxidation iron-sulfur protein [Chondrinema litorale]UZR94167.1 LutB/LldF family L-lactate oxidation iron-sulfur protein [Chondrinema litorale]
MDHPSAAAIFNKDEARTDWHDKALWYVRSKRDLSAKSIPEWEQLRQIASAIKAHALSNLDNYLIEFEENAKKNGITVHWAQDGKEHNEIVHSILQAKEVKKLVKSKSMLTEECHLNPYLEEKGIEVIDTDLGERIVQLSKEPPSHIVMPAIHKKKEDIGQLFHEKLGTEAGASDPQYLAEAARQHLRQNFLTADASLTGVNFAIAETGGVVVCTNEGNADLGVSLAPIHIASMGIEKLIPKAAHLGVFLRLLARSATGQPITSFSSHFHGPKPGSEMHIIIVDNGRTEQLGRDDFRKSLNCIRCGACMNTCPVYRRSGGHSYGYTVPGPIGSILSPGKDLKKYSTLPFASTLCGSCSDVCPVKIDIHTQLYKWRQIIAKEHELPWSKRQAMKVAGYMFSHPNMYRTAGKAGRTMLKVTPKTLVNGPWNVWGKSRDLPPPPKESFRDWYLKNRVKK